MHQAQWTLIPAETNSSMSYGFGVANLDCAYGHDGSYSGYHTSTMFRYQGYGIVILSNGQTQYSGQKSSADNIFTAVRSSLDQYLKAWD
jgi:hypothetical protein